MYKSVSHNKELIRKTTSLIGWRDIIKEDLKYQGKMKSYSLAFNRVKLGIRGSLVGTRTAAGVTDT